jgi:hypothetical protein
MKTKVMISMCDISGVMAEPWAEAGYVCLCIDIQNSIRATKYGRHKIKKIPDGGEIHYLWGDARSWKPSMFDKHFHQKYEIAFVACFPVCTNLAGSGAQDWELKGLAMLTDGLMLFNSCEQIADWSGAPYGIENPVGAITSHHRKPDFYFHPWYYGDLYQKKTCLWTGNGFVMPKAHYITKPEGVTQKIWLAPPSDTRQDERSETPAGFARAVFESNNKLHEANNLRQSAEQKQLL